MQQPSHPFLAEYNRKILFKTEKGKSDTINMFPNTGGRTLFNLYCQANENKKIIILEDNFGFYYYDINSNSYSESISSDTMNIINNSITSFLGRIDGETYPLRFVERKIESKKNIEHTWL